jgi:hypothetical protein
MAITAALCNSFKQEVMEGTHDMETDVLKMALYTSSASLGAGTTAYSATNEVSGTGYTAGGETLTSVAVTLDSSTGIVDFDDVSWTTSTITARGALIYNSTDSNKAIAVLDFTTDVSSSSSTFTVQIPAAAAATAIIALA